jgi:transposase
MLQEATSMASRASRVLRILTNPGHRGGIVRYFASGYDAGRLVIHAADVQDRDRATLVLSAIRHRFPWLRHVFADGGYASKKLRAALAKIGTWTVQIAKRTDKAKGFVVIPRRWVVERTFAWLGRNRRLAKDFERTIESATAWIVMASVQIITCRIANA